MITKHVTRFEIPLAVQTLPEELRALAVQVAKLPPDSVAQYVSMVNGNLVMEVVVEATTPLAGMA